MLLCSIEATWFAAAATAIVVVVIHSLVTAAIVVVVVDSSFSLHLLCLVRISIYCKSAAYISILYPIHAARQPTSKQAGKQSIHAQIHAKIDT